MAQTALGRNDFDPRDCAVPRDGGALLPLAEGGQAYLNTAMMLSAPNSSFAQRHWAFMRSWDGRHAVETICCRWPSRWAASANGLGKLQGAVSMRIFPFCLNDGDDDVDPRAAPCPCRGIVEDHAAWVQQLRRIAERTPTHAIHLAKCATADWTRDLLTSTLLSPR